MTVAQWNRVKELFDAALQVPSASRSAFVAAQDESPAVVEEVGSLLSVYQEAPEFLEGSASLAAIAAPSTAEDQSPLTGRMIGAWRLIREIGRGGMGVVWEAKRADQQYEQRAAIKLLPASLLSSGDIRRFRAERQILARLAHPGIARLLDGGTLDDGSPYLVMEYVDGETVDGWCEKRNAPLRQRLELFLLICEAVDYAHRNLVVHSDLKPANILVTQEGTPKLLDFGIARLLDADRGNTARGPLRLTPDYASPEQLRGEAVGTASDVYSLGVLLYVLLTGRKPQENPDPLQTLRAICQDDPPAPSEVAGSNQRLLRGELDAVVLQAMRNHPDQRYHSVRALADDVGAWLEGRPVSAIAPTRWYRTAKLIRRNKTQSAAVALAIMCLLGGTAVSLWQARVAQRQSERAEQRFKEAQKFSRSVLGELHDAIRNLPGSTAARNLLLARATEFLDGLSRDPSGDPDLWVELAQGYLRLGHVQGSRISDNLGRRMDAIASFRKAAGLGEQALAASGQNDEAAIVTLAAYNDLATTIWESRDRAGADGWYQKERKLAESLDARRASSDRLGSAIAGAYSDLALYRSQQDDLEGAKRDYRRSLGRFAELAGRGYRPSELCEQYAFALKRLGAILIVGNSLGEAERCYRTALGMEDQRLAARPGDRALLVDRTFTLSDLALILKKKGDSGHAARLYEEVLATRRSALGADPGNLRLISLTASTAANLAGVYPSLGRREESVRLAREAVGLRDAAVQVADRGRERADASAARVILAESLVDAAEHCPPGPQRSRSLTEAGSLLSEVRPLAETLRRQAVPSRSEQAFLTAVADLQASLRRLNGRP